MPDLFDDILDISTEKVNVIKEKEVESRKIIQFTEPNKEVSKKAESNQEKAGEIELNKSKSSEKEGELAEEAMGIFEGFGVVTITSQFDINNKSKDLVDKINWATSQRKTEFVQEIINLSKHSSVAVRRKAAESLSVLGNKEVITLIETWESGESDRKTILILRAVVEKLGRTNNFQQDKHILTVSEALQIVKNLIGKDIYQVEGEISGVSFYPTMCYFRLKENQDNSLDCGCYVGKIHSLGFDLTEGLSVRVTGRFRIKNSKFSLEAMNIELTGEGAILQNLKKLEERLSKEGLFDPSRKRTISKFPSRILLIASGNSAAMGDFLKVLGHRRTGITIFHQNIKSQGVGAELEILDELARTNSLIDKYKIDTVVMTRGGGSTEDLFVFNSEKIIRSLHGITRPVIVAIGHERDVSLTEKAADLRASTPSNAAELVSYSNVQIGYFLEQSQAFYTGFFQEKVSQYQNFTSQVCDYGVQFFKNEIQKAQEITQKTDGLIFQIIGNIKQTLANNQLYYNQTMTGITQKRQQTKFSYQQIFNQVQQKWQQAHNQTLLLESQLEIENPTKILAKGYAIIKQNDKVITKIQEIDKNEKIEITMQDGKLEV
jgi:exodeoxyribonuclease VII large subunit